MFKKSYKPQFLDGNSQLEYFEKTKMVGNTPKVVKLKVDEAYPPFDGSALTLDAQMRAGVDMKGVNCIALPPSSSQTERYARKVLDKISEKKEE